MVYASSWITIYDAPEKLPSLSAYVDLVLKNRSLNCDVNSYGVDNTGYRSIPYLLIWYSHMLFIQLIIWGGAIYYHTIIIPAYGCRSLNRDTQVPLNILHLDIFLCRYWDSKELSIIAGGLNLTLYLTRATHRGQYVKEHETRKRSAHHLIMNTVIIKVYCGNNRYPKLQQDALIYISLHIGVLIYPVCDSISLTTDFYYILWVDNNTNLPSSRIL